MGRSLEDVRYFDDTTAGDQIELTSIQEVYADVLEICHKSEAEVVKRNWHTLTPFKTRVDWFAGFMRLFGEIDINSAKRMWLTDKCLETSLSHLL